MVRYARAKGSKASNEKIPNEATPWHVMKEQLEEVQEKKNQITEVKKSAKQLLGEKEEPYYATSLNTNSNWAEFEETGSKNKSSVNRTKDKVIHKKKEKSNKKLKQQIDNSDIKIEKVENNSNSVNDDVQESGETKVDQKLNEKKVKSKEKKKRNNKNKEKRDDNYNSEREIRKDDNNRGGNSNKLSLSTKRRLRRERIQEKKRLEALDGGKAQTPENTDVEKKSNLKRKHDDGESKKTESSEIVGEAVNESNGQVLTKRQKRNLKKRKSNENYQQNDDNFDKPKNNKFDGNNHFGKSDKEPMQGRQFNRNGPAKPVPRHNHTTPGKIRDDKEHPRRKPLDSSIKMTINGIEVEIVKFEGFPVKKEDAVRLKDLRQQMVMKGIPKSEIETAMKLERRKAEKALARIRKQVCFLCRTAGHNLSDCPNLDKEQTATGVCFKCGSTEHTHFECKVNRTDDYRFASCFICRQKGHIAKQCPDNPKGLYPDGGACNVCGDVTHLKKDCPDLLKKKEENTVTVNTISDDTLECLDEDFNKKNKTENAAKQKVIKF